MTHSPEYLEAISSQHWEDLKDAIEMRHGWRCQTCGCDGYLELHHLHYRTLGRESMSDVRLLCPRCHEFADRKRATETEHRRWWARVDGWASKVYGEDWEEYHDSEEVEERFVEWLESKGECDG